MTTLSPTPIPSPNSTSEFGEGNAPLFSVRMVCELKGAPLACLILLAMSGQPVSNEWLCMMSGYTDKPVALALKKLSSPEFQMARRAFGGWVMNRVVQLPFQLSDNSRNISVPTTTALDNNLVNSNAVVVASRKNSDSFDENYSTCLAVGIGEPAASQISNLDYVTPEFIRAHVNGLKRPKEGIGLAILRIKGNEEAPFDPDGADWMPEKKYTEGAFAEYFAVSEEEA